MVTITRDFEKQRGERRDQEITATSSPYKTCGAQSFQGTVDVLKNPAFEAIAVDVEQQRGRDSSVSLTLTLTLVVYRYSVHTASSPTG